VAQDGAESAAGGGEGDSSTGCGDQALVYRAPGCLAVDARRVAVARSCPALEAMLFGPGPAGHTNCVSPKLAHAVFFSTSGERPLADYLAGGDYDGDDFLVCLDRELVSLFNHLPPGELPGASIRPPAAPPPAKSPPVPASTLSSVALETALADDFFNRVHSGAFDVGRAATALKAICDRFGMADQRTLRLGEFYHRGLDEPLSRAESEELRALAVEAAGVRPAWMDEEEATAGNRRGGAGRDAGGEGSAMTQIHTHVLAEMRKRQELAGGGGGGGGGGMDRNIAMLVRHWAEEEAAAAWGVVGGGHAAAGAGGAGGVHAVNAATTAERQLVWKSAVKYAKAMHARYLDEYHGMDRAFKELENSGTPVPVEMRIAR
jgi:hypothetical protein